MNVCPLVGRTHSLLLLSDSNDAIRRTYIKSPMGTVILPNPGISMAACVALSVAGMTVMVMKMSVRGCLRQ